MELTPSYILHIRPFKDSSAILDCFTQQHGLVSMVARGVKRSKSKFYGLIQPFIALQLSWVGKSELKTLIQVESEQWVPTISGQKILVGFYLNELLMRLLARNDPHPTLFTDYDESIKALSAVNSDMAEEMVLRRFELKLLIELGYGLNLTAIDPELIYAYDPNIGLVEATGPKVPHSLSGASIIALREGIYQDENQLREAKKLMRAVLSQYLGKKPLESRKLFLQVGDGLQVT
jgi:DNA repair protein RecO (recombination protein O)